MGSGSAATETAALQSMHQSSPPIENIPRDAYDPHHAQGSRKGFNWNAVKNRGCPRNCDRRANVHGSTEASSLGKEDAEAMTREPGDLPSAVVLLAAGVR